MSVIEEYNRIISDTNSVTDCLIESISGTHNNRYVMCVAGKIRSINECNDFNSVLELKIELADLIVDKTIQEAMCSAAQADLIEGEE